MKFGRFCYGKDKNVSEEKKAKGAGSLWTWTALDADSKLIVSYLCGGRDASWAISFMKDVASRLTTRVQITTDGHKAYVEAVEGAFGMEVDYAMLIKLYGNACAAGHALQPRRVHRNGNGRNRKPGPETYQHVLCGAPESHDADDHAAVYPAHKCLLKETREP